MAMKWVHTSSCVLSTKDTKLQKGSTQFLLPPSRPNPVYLRTCAGEHHLRYTGYRSACVFLHHSLLPRESIPANRESVCRSGFTTKHRLPASRRAPRSLHRRSGRVQRLRTTTEPRSCALRSYRLHGFLQYLALPPCLREPSEAGQLVPIIPLAATDLERTATNDDVAFQGCWGALFLDLLLCSRSHVSPITCSCPSTDLVCGEIQRQVDPGEIPAENLRSGRARCSRCYTDTCYARKNCGDPTR
jgi:hypothetical protein